jgi:hypothetical protein
MSQLERFRDRGARALVLLHERELRSCVATWRRAVAWGVVLPVGSGHYASPNTLLRHVLAAAAGYLRWVAEKLDLGDAAVDPVPEPDAIEERADAYLEHVLDRWREVLRELPGERLGESHRSNWGADLSIESMLEHAVVHPMRHALQLEELMNPS